jgi:hypothetical protein
VNDLELDEDAAVRALLAVLDQYVLDHTPYFNAKPQLPEGLRLEIHPLVYYMIMRSADQGFRMVDEPLKRIPMPVKITPELPRYGWRLVIVTEEVINGGLMPHPGQFPVYGPQPKEP